MSSTRVDSDIDVGDLSSINVTLLTLRKPTELKKVVDSVPKPARSVPKNGLPFWYRLGLECKLPVPKIPEGKIVFSRGKIGEDIRRVGLGPDCPRPTFDLTDPYCNNVSYKYVAMHDPHLAQHYCQKPARNRMKQLGLLTKDGRAVCSLLEFNQYRKYLYNRYMDRIHMEMAKLDERARDDLMLKRVEVDVERRLITFNKKERAREHMEKANREMSDEWAEKKRSAKEKEAKVQARIKYLTEFKEKQKQERSDRVHEKEARIKMRVHAAAEMELRRKITMLRQWRINEKKRLNRIKQDKESKRLRLEKEAADKWNRRIEAQNCKIQEEALLLKIYTEDMTAGATRRAKRAEVYAYNNDLQLQRIRLANWKEMHGKYYKEKQLVRKMGIEFEKSKRGAKGMSAAVARKMAEEAMTTAVSTGGDALMILAQARARMDMETVLPSAPIKLLDHMLDTAIMMFTRRRVHLLLRDVERAVHSKAYTIFFRHFHPGSNRRRSKAPRYSIQLTTQLASQYADVRAPSIVFGGVTDITPKDDQGISTVELKPVKDRPPTPVPSMTKLAEVTFTDKVEDLPDPVSLGAWLPERRKLLEMVNTAARLLSRSVSHGVQKGMDITVGKVTLPQLKHPMEWGEAVEGLADAVVGNRVNSECADLRRTSAYLAHRVLRSLQVEMRENKAQRKSSVAPGTNMLPPPAPVEAHISEMDQLEEPVTDFYVPENS